MKILAFGEVMMRMMPVNYKTLTQTDQLEFLFTGTGVNILSALYQMGDKGYMATRLPDNNVGKAAAAQMRKLGIDDCFVKYGGSHMGIYFLEQGIGNRASQVTYLNRNESSFCLSQVQDYDFSCLDEVDALHICGISLAINENLRDVVFAFINEAKKRSVKIIFDCNFRPSLWNEKNHNDIKNLYENVLKNADIVFCGLKDATLLLDITVDDNLPYYQQVEIALQKMHRIYNIEVLFGTYRFSKEKQDYISGYMYCHNGFITSKDYELTVFDRIGGGDGFAAGAIHGYFHCKDNQELIDYATCSGVLAHTTYGDSPIMSKESIIDFMKNGKTDVKR